MNLLVATKILSIYLCKRGDIFNPHQIHSRHRELDFYTFDWPGLPQVLPRSRDQCSLVTSVKQKIDWTTKRLTFTTEEAQSHGQKD